MSKVKLTLTCSECGCDFTHTHYLNNRSSAESYEEWAKDNITVCPDCYEEEMRKAERAKNDASAEAGKLKLAELGIELPPLTGTEKQVAWAESIRDRCAKIFVEAGAKDKAWDTFKSKTDARFWIDIRDYAVDSDCPVGYARHILSELMK